MSANKEKKNPIARLFARLQKVNEQTYCGDSDNCQPLSYSKGNLNQDLPKRVPVWDSCPVKDETGKPVE